MACNDPFHAVFAEVEEALRERTSLYSLDIRKPDGTTVRKRLPSFNAERTEALLKRVDELNVGATRLLLDGKVSAFDMPRIERDAERLKMRIKGKRYGATQQRKDAIGNGTVVERERTGGVNTAPITLATFSKRAKPQA